MTEAPGLQMVTGAFGYTGKYIARRLLSKGLRVATLTGHPDTQDPLRDHLTVFPLDFESPAELRRSLQGVDVLYNTYWVRFPMGRVTYEYAVENIRTLIQAARDAGVRRIVHLSITRASEESPLPYFRGKGRVETAVISSGLSYAILRPTVIFGPEDILINNIAWLLRRFPVYAVPGSGDYRLQPVFVEDVAELAARAGQEEDNFIIDAVGPETYTFEELVRLIADVVHSRAKIIHLHPRLALLAARPLGYGLKDVVTTEDEVRGLMADLLVSQEPPTGRTSFSEWLRENADSVGARYASELARRHLR